MIFSLFTHLSTLGSDSFGVFIHVYVDQEQIFRSSIAICCNAVLKYLGAELPCVIHWISQTRTRHCIAPKERQDVWEANATKITVHRVQRHTLILANPYINNFLWSGMHIYQIPQGDRYSYIVIVHYLPWNVKGIWMNLWKILTFLQTKPINRRILNELSLQTNREISLMKQIMVLKSLNVIKKTYYYTSIFIDWH